MRSWSAKYRRRQSICWSEVSASWAEFEWTFVSHMLSRRVLPDVFTAQVGFRVSKRGHAAQSDACHAVEQDEVIAAAERVLVG
jgi:hypothetical protein